MELPAIAARVGLEELDEAGPVAAVEREHGAARDLELDVAGRRAQHGEAVLERVAAVVVGLAAAHRPDLEPLRLGRAHVAAAPAEGDDVLADAHEQVDRDRREPPRAARPAGDGRLLQPVRRRPERLPRHRR